MGKLYDETSIESLTPLEFTRLRPGVYAGDCTYSTQLLIEILKEIESYPIEHALATQRMIVESPDKDNATSMLQVGEDKG